MIKGFITGSFRPFHKGHEALIDYAKEHCDELTILITTLKDEVIPYKYRLKWVLSTYLDDPQITVIADVITEPDITGDALSGWWGNYVFRQFGHFDRVFTSESYGDLFAKSMGAEHWRFNQSRTIVPISATNIRRKPITNWDYLNNFAKDYFVKKIAIVGTESTGKSTLAKQLAEHYNTLYVPDNPSFIPEIGRDLVSNAVGAPVEDETFVHEIGRDLVPNPKGCTVKDLQIVGVEHAKSIIKCTRLANKILIIDTDLNITKSYAKYLFGETLRYDPWVEKANEIDLYIYLTKDTPYIDDGTRLPESERDMLDNGHYSFFKDKNNVIRLSWLTHEAFTPVINQRRYDKRLKYAIQEIDAFLKKY